MSTFRRIVLTTDKIDQLKDDLDRLFSLNKMKIDFPNLKIDIKIGVKPNTLIVDLTGDGADSVSKKVKDAGVKFGAQYLIKLEKSMGKNLKETIKKVLKEEFDDEFIKYNTEMDDDDYHNLSPLEMAEGNINIDNFKKFCDLGKGLVKNLKESGYFGDEQECVGLLSQLLVKNLSTNYNISAKNNFSLNEKKK